MPVYKVTVSVRGVMNIEAKDTAEAGTIAHDYLEGCVKSGQVTRHKPKEVLNISCNTFVQAATTDL